MGLLYLYLVKLQWTLMGGVRPVYCRQVCQNSGGVGGMGTSGWLAAIVVGPSWSIYTDQLPGRHNFANIMNCFRSSENTLNVCTNRILEIWDIFCHPLVYTGVAHSHFPLPKGPILHLGFSWKKRKAKSCPYACYEVTGGNGCTSPRILNFGTRLK